MLPFRPCAGRGQSCSLLLVVNVLPRLCLFLLFALYLSLFYAGQVFMSYQWDLFLLEMGFAALLLSFATTPGIFLLRWLMFRFMFMSGVVKLLSGDLRWWNLTALDYHFLTQPLPTPLAWYAAHTPPGPVASATRAMFFVELVLPFFIFSPRLSRSIAAFGFLLLRVLHPHHPQLQLVQSPDHAALPAAVRRRGAAEDIARSPCRAKPRPIAPKPAVTAVVSAIAVLIVFCSLVRMDLRFGGTPPAFARAIDGWIRPLNVVSGYGLFAIMTPNRREVVIVIV